MVSRSRGATPCAPRHAGRRWRPRAALAGAEAELVRVRLGPHPRAPARRAALAAKEAALAGAEAELAGASARGAAAAARAAKARERLQDDEAALAALHAEADDAARTAAAAQVRALRRRRRGRSRLRGRSVRSCRPGSPAGRAQQCAACCWSTPVGAHVAHDAAHDPAGRDAGAQSGRGCDTHPGAGRWRRCSARRSGRASCVCTEWLVQGKAHRLLDCCAARRPCSALPEAARCGGALPLLEAGNAPALRDDGGTSHAGARRGDGRGGRSGARRGARPGGRRRRGGGRAGGGSGARACAPGRGRARARRAARPARGGGGGRCQAHGGLLSRAVEMVWHEPKCWASVASCEDSSATSSEGLACSSLSLNTNIQVCILFAGERTHTRRNAITLLLRFLRSL